MIGQLGMMGAGALIQNEFNKATENRQWEREKKLLGMQMQNQQQLNKQGFDMQFDMWNKTNFAEQMKQMKKAGLNPNMIYGMKGGGGVTTGSQTGGSAPKGNAPQAQGMDIRSMLEAGMMKSLIAVNEATAKKLNAETENTAGGIRENLSQDAKRKEFELNFAKEMKDVVQQGMQADADIKFMNAQERNAYWEMKKAIGFNTGAYDDPNSNEAKAYRAGMSKSELEVDAIKQELAIGFEELDKAKSDAAIKKFEALLSQYGITPTSIAAGKLVADLISDVVGYKKFSELLKQGNKPTQETQYETINRPDGSEVRREKYTKRWR